MELVIPDTAKPLQEAVAAFVAARRALSDREERPPWFAAWKDTVDAHVFVDGSIPGDYACPPAVTMATVLPFFDVGSNERSAYRPAKVPVRFVVGSSWRWHEGSLPDRVPNVQAAIDLFTGGECARLGGMGAEVVCIQPLGMFYVGGEGKNRIAFLARHGVEFMPCMLSMRSYPSADRLQIIAVREGPMGCWVCVLDGEHAVTIPYPEFTLPILRAYGVKQTAWREEYPMLATVMNSFRLQPADADGAIRSGPTKPVSFSHLKRREIAAANPSVDSFALLSHPDLMIDVNYLRNLAVSGAVAVLCGVLLKSLSVAEGNATFIMTLVFGALIGALAILWVPVAKRPERLSKGGVAEKAADRSELR